MKFDNTEIAFSYKNTRELKKAKFIFKYLFSPWLIFLGKLLILLANFFKIPAVWAVKGVFNHFCGGTDLNNCNQIISKLESYNVKAIADYSVEGGGNENDVEKSMCEILKSIDFAATRRIVPFVVFKPSALGNLKKLEEINELALNRISIKNLYPEFYQRVNEICNSAFEKNISVLIDAEDFSFQNTVDAIALEMMIKYNQEKTIVYNTFQMYRKDRLKYIGKCIEIAQKCNFKIGAKLVRGAYLEKERTRAKKFKYPTPVFDTKNETDESFNNALIICIQNIQIVSIFCGTHNENSINYLIDLMNEKNIEKNDTKVYFSQLFGMSDDLTFNLAHSGYNAVKYIPYGPIKKVIPYLIRRATENSSTYNQKSRELLLLEKEINRRKLLKK